MDHSEISILFKSLVILPADKIDSAISSESYTTKAAEPKEEKTPTSILQNTETSDAVDTPNSKQPELPILILTTPALKAAYLSPDSNFLKTITALKSPQLAGHISDDITLISSIADIKWLWCIGLDIKLEKQIQDSLHTNFLCSPDLNSLKTNEEKKAMFGPLKDFINSNLELISKM